MTQEEWLKIGNKWKTTDGKIYVLFPALDSVIGNYSGKSILDVGCGDGVFIRRCKDKGANAIGIDVSPDTIKSCKEKDSSGEYVVMDIKKDCLNEKFDYVSSLFVLLSFDKKEEIIKAIKNMSKSLNENGRLIIAVPHPAFEEADNANSMKKSFSNKEYAYTKKGLPVLWTHRTKKDIYFTDFHWMIEDYVECIRKSGLAIEDIREPVPLPEYEEENSKIYHAMKKYPPMILFICKRCAK